MKKLIMFTAAAVAAVCVNAASIDWSLGKNSIMTQSGAAAKGIDVYFLNASASTYADTLSKIASGDITATSISSSGAYLGSGTTGTTNAKAGSLSGTSSANGSTLTPGTSYDVVFVTFEKVGDDNYYYVSSASSGSAWGGSEYSQDLAQVAKWDSTNFSAGNWKTVSASGGTDPLPEPTSGLLLLVGGAMLALRRKRA